MSIPRALFLVILCCSVPLRGQARPSADVPFAGCYRIVSQRWRPMNEDASPIPGRFQLLSEATAEPNKGIFAMRSIPASNNVMEKQWVWQPKGDRLWMSWGRGLGGFRGTLKQSGGGEFVGKIKEWCDSRCEWKRSIATIRIQKIDCTQ